MTCTDRCVRPTPSQAHCATCHKTFSGVALFDAHRTGPMDNRVCRNPTMIPANQKPDAPYIPVKLVRGVWRYDVPRTNVPTRPDLRAVGGIDT